MSKVVLPSATFPPSEPRSLRKFPLRKGLVIKSETLSQNTLEENSRFEPVIIRIRIFFPGFLPVKLLQGFLTIPKPTCSYSWDGGGGRPLFTFPPNWHVGKKREKATTRARGGGAEKATILLSSPPPEVDASWGPGRMSKGTIIQKEGGREMKKGQGGKRSARM